MAKLAAVISEQVVHQLPKKALTQGFIYPIVKKVASRLGVRMTTQTSARGVSKIVPVVGGVVSGGLAVATFLPMTKKLKRHLADSELTKPTDWKVETKLVWSTRLGRC